LEEGHVRVRSWEEFKCLVSEKKPKSIVFILEQNGFSPNKELTTLRIILLSDRRYYIFLDFPKGEALRETKIPLHKDKNGIPNLDEDEVKAFLKKQFEKEKIDVFSFWTA
jgi:DNA polymerase III epsilon subunit-like protein